MNREEDTPSPAESQQLANLPAPGIVQGGDQDTLKACPAEGVLRNGKRLRGGRAPLGIVRISARGTVTDLQFSVVGCRVGGSKRGVVQGFTSASARRLRRYLVEWTGRDGWKCRGVTLTVPGPVVSDGEWRRVWQVYRNRLNRAGVAAIWRVELQRRLQPHVHLVGWYQGQGWTVFEEAWHAVVRGMGPCEWKGEALPDRMAIAQASYRSCVSSTPLNRHDDFVWFRYLAAHASKGKQAQLGWHGRQWGVIGRSLLWRDVWEGVELSDREMYRLIRCLKRLSGCKRASGRGSQTWFVRRHSAMRACAWAASERTGSPPAIVGGGGCWDEV